MFTQTEKLEKLFVSLIFSLALTFSGCDAPNAAKQENKGFPAENRAAASKKSEQNAESAKRDENAESAARVDSSAASEEKGDDGVLFDFRKQTFDDLPKIAAARKRAIIEAVYGKNGGGSGDDEVEINSVAHGSFTKISAKETAYMLQPGGARAVDPGSYEDVRLAVFSGDKLVAQFKAEECNFILRTVDADKDGKDELLLEGSVLQMGISMDWAKLVGVEDRRLNVVEDFKIVERDDCGTEQAGADVKAVLLKYVRRGGGGAAQIERKYFSAPCPANADGKIPLDAFRLTADRSIEQ